MKRAVWRVLATAGAVGAITVGALASVQLLSDGGLVPWVAVLVLMILLLLICLQIWRITLRIHPWLKRYYITTIVADEILERINSGEAFTLELGGEQRRVMARPEPVSDPGAEIVVVGEEGEIERSVFDDTVTYAGEVVGDESSEVRLTITSEMFGGYVMEAGNWWFIEPLLQFRPDARATEHLVYRTKDLRFKLSYGSDLMRHTVEQLDPGSLPPGSGYIGEPPPPPPDPTSHKVGPDIGIALVADQESYNGNKWTQIPWYMHQIRVLNEVNGIYRRNLGYRFLAKVWIMDAHTLTSTNADALLTQLRIGVTKIWANLGLVTERIRTGTEVAHLTSGKDLDGKTLGIADMWTVNWGTQGVGGIYSLTQQFIKRTWFGGIDPPNLQYRNLMIMAHELGHSFNAVHDEAVEWCAKYFIFCVDKQRSLMWDTFYFDNWDWISDGVYRKGRDNRQRIVNNATLFRTYDLGGGQ